MALQNPAYVVQGIGGPVDMYMFKDVHHRSRDAGETLLRRSKVDNCRGKAFFVKSR